MAYFLDNFFKEFDYIILAFFHNLALKAGNFLTPFCKFLAITGNFPFLLVGFLALILAISKKYRRIGLTMLVSMIIGAIMTSLIIKPIVLRLRPYQSGNELYKKWWEYVGSSIEHDSSFSSGHTCVAASSAMGYYLASKNKYKILAFIYPLLMACSRIYLCVHYPSDVLGGIIVGTIASLLANTLVSYIYKKRALGS